MTYYTEIAKDRREIQSVHMSGDYQTQDFRVGSYGVTKIVTYEDAGEMAYIPFIAVYKGDEISVRMPANNMVIYYADAPTILTSKE